MTEIVVLGCVQGHGPGLAHNSGTRSVHLVCVCVLVVCLSLSVQVLLFHTHTLSLSVGVSVCLSVFLTASVAGWVATLAGV